MKQLPRLHFATSNDYKFGEFSRLFRRAGINLVRFNIDLPEIQMIDIEPIVRDKLVKAYASIGRPVLVDHSGMALHALGGLPGGLNRQFWEVLHGRICQIAHSLGDPSAEILVALGVCDGRSTHVVTQHVRGRIALTPSKQGVFHLDQVFVPAGEAVPLSALSQSRRDTVGQRGKATRRLLRVLKRTTLGRSLGL